ncbi:hypothetical protein JCM16303_004559 [Sporobolomyces ruberrimus]
MLASLRIASQLAFATLSLVLFGVSCAALVTDDLQGNPAVAVLAFVAGLSTLMIPGIAFLSYTKPGHWIQTTFFHLGAEVLLFVFLTSTNCLFKLSLDQTPADPSRFRLGTAGLVELTYNQSSKLSHCMSPPSSSELTPKNFGLVCTILQTLMGVGWTCWSLLTLVSLTTVLLGVRRFWRREEGVLRTPVDELWDRGWNGSWEKQQHNGYA